MCARRQVFAGTKSVKIFALGSSEFGGDWHPLAAVLNRLATRGHGIRVVGDRDLQRWIEAAKLPADTVIRGPEFGEYVREKEGDQASKSESELFDSWSRAQFQTTLDEMRRTAPEVLMCSLIKLPLSVRLRIERQIPLCFVNPGIYFGHDDERRLEVDYPRPAFREVIRYWRSLQDSADLVLHASSQVLDPFSEELPPHHRYLGPSVWEIPGDLPDYVKTPGHPWVLVGLSTAVVHREIPFIRAVLKVLAEKPVRALATVSEPGLLSKFDLPSNAKVEAYVPHTKILRRSKLLISHGGHGGVIKSLYCGVPMVLIPRSADQFAIALRARALGAAEIVYRKEVTHASLSEAVEQVLNDPEYTENAQKAAKRLGEDEHMDECCKLIEAMAS